jgi:hypothetical protein
MSSLMFWCVFGGGIGRAEVGVKRKNPSEGKGKKTDPPFSPNSQLIFFILGLKKSSSLPLLTPIRYQVKTW